MNKPSREDMFELWNSLDEDDFYRDAARAANQRRINILPYNQIAVRKTFGLNNPGCSVNCNYCTLGTQYTGNWNRNYIRDNVESEIMDFHEMFPDLECNIELVGYWHGINRYNSEFEKLTRMIEKTHPHYPIIGGDLGIILEEDSLNELRDAGLTYLHNNLETSQRLYPAAIGKNTERFKQKIETIQLAERCGLETTSGILIGIGENIEDLIEQVFTLRSLPIRRIAVNFMDYQSDQRIAERFRNGQKQLTPKYASRILIFMRNFIGPNQSLMVGSGVGEYLYDEENFPELLNIVDTIHIGSFINLKNQKNTQELLKSLRESEHKIVPSPYFN